MSSSIQSFKRIRPFQIALLSLSLLAGCASGPSPRPVREWIDSTTRSETPPAWVNSTQVSWTDDKRPKLELYRGSSTIRGDQRVPGCFGLAKLQARDQVLTQVSSKVKSLIMEANESLSELADQAFSEFRSVLSEGELQGLRFKEEYFERYRIGETERVDCFALGEISKNEIERLKQRLLKHTENTSPELKEALRSKTLDFIRQ